MSRVVRIGIITFGLIASSPVFASSLVYTPTNPTFGGNPANGTFLLDQAQTQGAGAKSGNSPDVSALASALSGLSSSSSSSTSTSSTVANPLGN